MDRRTFLKALMALGVSLPTPLDLLAASDREIDATWKQARDVWGLFEVSEGGVLSFANYENLDRADAYCLPWAAQLSVEDIEHCQPLQWKVSALCLEELEAHECDEDGERVADSRSLDEIAEADWPAWFRGLQGQRRAEVHAELDTWLRDEPDWNWEDDYLPDRATGQGAAFEYFSEAESEVRKALRIHVIEGDRPGSNYIAAELHMPIEEANAIAEESGWTIRFVEESAA
jgi:hypothetical protein